MIPAIVAAAVAVLAIIVLVTRSVLKGAANRKEWDSQFICAQYILGPVSFTWCWNKTGYMLVGQLDAALERALTAISYSGVWGLDQLREAFDHMHVVVHPTPTWDGVHGFADATTYSYALIHVGSDCAALAHELVEVLLQKVVPLEARLMVLVDHDKMTLEEATTLLHPSPREDNWWSNTQWGKTIMKNYADRMAMR